jgi:squalene cyclase
MRTVAVHPEKSIRFTKHAAFWCEMINLYKRNYPKHSFRQIAEHFELSETNARRYYYGIHHHNAGYFGCGYTQFREGACVTI